MARFDALRGNAASKAAEAVSKAKRSRFTPQFKWDDGERKYLQFVTPFDERVTAPMHQFIRVARDPNTKSGYKYADFLLAPEEDGSSPVDLIHQKFGVEPTFRTIAVAVEMEPIIEKDSKGRKRAVGFEPKMREWEDKDGETHESPELGLVIMSHNNFWKFFEMHEEQTGPVDASVFAVTRLGKSTDTNYHVEEAGDAIELDDLDTESRDYVDIDKWLEEVADPERMEALISPLPEDWEVNQYANRGKDEKKAKPKKNSRLKKVEKKATKVPADDAGADEGDGQEDSSEGEPVSDRKARFANLRKDMAARA